MGKAGRWLRSFLTGKKAARDDKGKSDGRGPLPPPTPAAKERRRWSFRRPAVVASGRDVATTCASTSSSHCFSEVLRGVVQEQEQDQHAAAATPEVVTVAVVDPPAWKWGEEEAAAVKIQSAFRSYLARKALCALRGMVKLQAMVRGQLVRRQADMTLRRIQALVAAQRRARAERMRLRLLEDGNGKPRPRTATRRSPQHHHRSSSRRPLEAVDGGSDENVKVVEVDDGGGGDARARRSSSCCSTPGKAEQLYYHKASPTVSGLTDGTARWTFSGRFEVDHSASFSAASEASGRHRDGKACHAAADHALLLLPRSYMANTESSRAKARSQSAPRHRHSDASASASSPSSFFERPPTGSGGGRRRASLDPRDLAAAAGARTPSPRISSSVMERCASRCAVRPDSGASASVSLPTGGGSECGSSCTVPASARIA